MPNESSAGHTMNSAGKAARQWRRRARHIHQLIAMSLLDPLEVVRRFRGWPHYIRNWREYSRQVDAGAGFHLSFADLLYSSYDRFGAAGSLKGHYFLQDLWAAQSVVAADPSVHIDVGSRVDGFVAHVLPSCDVIYIDVRPLEMEVAGLTPISASICELPFADQSVGSLSSLHVLEHIGLGRYGDPLDPEGHVRAAAELSRVLAPGGSLLLGTPVGRERLCFDAHRVFDPETVAVLFGSLELAQFSLIPDNGDRVVVDARFEDARACEFGCGLYRFTRSAGGA
jgi:SAM-dependent methyltransferase